MTFDEFVAKKDADRAVRDEGRVTWRKVSPSTGGGYSGIGAAGKRMLARVLEPHDGGYEYGVVVDGSYERVGKAPLLVQAKVYAASALNRRIREAS